MYLDMQELYDEKEALDPEVEEWTNIVNAHEEEARIDEYPGLEAIARYGELCELFDELGADARYETAILESDFEEYAQELAEDIGAVDRDNSWPNYCIDWKQAARDLAMDYTSFQFEGRDYLVRSC